MGMFADNRMQVIERVNHAFQPSMLESTIERVALTAEDDFLDIFDRLDILFYLRPGQLDAYRAKLAIPELNRRVLTLAFRYAIETRTPLKFDVLETEAEAVEVICHPDRIEVDLSRTDYDNLAGTGIV